MLMLKVLKSQKRSEPVVLWKSQDDDATDEPEAPTIGSCFACGAGIRADAKHCTQCGNRVAPKGRTDAEKALSIGAEVFMTQEGVTRAEAVEKAIHAKPYLYRRHVDEVVNGPRPIRKGTTAAEALDDAVRSVMQKSRRLSYDDALTALVRSSEAARDLYDRAAAETGVGDGWV